MNHNVYILGAGFSREAGLPLIADFKDEMVDAQDWLASECRHDELESVRVVLKFRQIAGGVCEYVNFSPNNIEQLFSLASAYDPELTSDVCKAIAATLDYCETKGTKGNYLVSTLDHENYPPSTPRTKYEGSVFGQFARLFAGKFVAKSTHNTIITLNYDTLLEAGFREVNCPYSYRPTKPGRTSIFKLHGSTNWTGEHEYKSYKELREKQLTPLLLPPTWNKTITNRKLRIAWDSAIRSLQSATRIIIIGFSFPLTDLHFRYLLSAGLIGNIDLKQIMIVDPHPEPIQENLSAIFSENPRTLFTYHAGAASSFLFARDKLRVIDRINNMYSIEPFSPPSMAEHGASTSQ